jgi:hypothetical protein
MAHLERSAKKNMNYDKGYCLEKGKNVLNDLRFILADLERDELSPKDLKAAIRSSISSALWNLTKVMSCVSETGWDSEDREKVMGGGEEGVEDLLVRYGWLTKEQTKKYRIGVAAKRLYHLSKGERSPSRTLMHEALRSIPDGTPPFEPLRDMLENVTQGVGKWSELQKWCELHLKEYDQP